MKAKKSAIIKGYFNDPFVSIFVPEKISKDVVLNRGYYLRY